MSKEKIIPQIEAENASKGACKARYTAYMQYARKLEQKAKADKASKEKAERIGGAKA